MRDAQTRLLRAFEAMPCVMPPLRAARSEAWASATFAGARHRLELEPVDAPQADAFAAHVLAAEYNLPGHLVADIAVAARTVTADGVALTIEALTVEEG